VFTRKFAAVVGIAALAASCAESEAPFGALQHTIELPGNTVGTAGCASIDLANCFAILDNQYKILYETNNWAARRGEAQYRVVTDSNKQLAAIFQSSSTTVAEALEAIDGLIADITSARDRGDYGACWGNYLLERARWVRSKVATGNLDLSDEPQRTCWVSPVTSFSGTGTETGGVTLTASDRWHFTGDPYGIYTTRTWFVVEGPSGTITTPISNQTGAASVTIFDPATTAPGTYSYSIVQCADWGQCSAPVSTSVTITAGSTGGGSGEDPGPTCIHDNRNKTFDPKLSQEKCEKEIKVGHPNS
jgi:hypothetical protein